MILTKEVTVTIINHNFYHYKSLGYDVKCRDTIIVPIEHLSKGSHEKIEYKCDICGKDFFVKFLDYNNKKHKEKDYCKYCSKEMTSKTIMEKYGVNNASKLQFVKDKKVKTTLEHYGVENPFQSEIIKTKSIETLIEKYGEDWSTITKKRLDYDIGLFKEYSLTVRRETYKQKKILKQNWNGYDVYDGEYIKDNFIYTPNNRLYPTVDHKISINYGFLNNIQPEEIANVNNLCYTKRYINGMKNKKIEEQFKKIFNQNEDKKIK